MIRLQSIDIENFLSIEKVHIDFDDSGLLLLEGWNFDVDRANGAGKTAILNAVSFALYDKLPRKITSSEILRRGTKKGFVSLRLVADKTEYIVKRLRPKGVEYFTSTDISSTEIKITQEEWERKLGLTYKQFIVSMYCSQANSSASPRFLLLNDSDKKEFLLQLLNLDEFSLCKKKTDKKIEDVLQDISKLHNQLNILQSKVETYSESMIDETQTRLILAQKETSKQLFIKQLNQTNYPKPDLSKYLKLEDDILSKKTEFTKLQTRRESFFAQWNKLNRSIKPFNKDETCSMCGTELDNSHALQVHEEEMHKLKIEQQGLKKQMDDIDVHLLEESKVNELYIKLKERKRKESSEYEKAVLAQHELTSQLQIIESQIEDLNKKLSANASLADRVNKLNMQKVEINKELRALSTELELQKTVANIYSPTGAQAYVLDSSVNLFNEQVSKHVAELWPNLTYELQSYKETVDGGVTAKFSEAIVMDGKSISLGSLSGGELKALSICADMALLGILEQQFGLHMSPIIFDEAFDGLDTSGKEFALDLIKNLGQTRQVIVIDHASEMRTAFDKILRVEKRNGISTLVNV